MTEINLPATPEEVHEALHQCTAKAVQAGAAGRDDEARSWLARYESLQEAACARWPGEGFEPYEPDATELTMDETMESPTWAALGEAQSRLSRTAWALQKAKQAHAEANAQYVEAHTAHFGHPPRWSGCGLRCEAWPHTMPESTVSADRACD